MREATIFIAHDGKEFRNSRECMEYESDCRSKVEDAVEKMHVPTLHNVVPMQEYGLENHYKSTFEWYIVRNKEDMEALDTYFPIDDIEEFNTINDSELPTYICVETFVISGGGKEYEWYNLRDYLEIVEDYLASFNVEVRITPASGLWNDLKS